MKIERRGRPKKQENYPIRWHLSGELSDDWDILIPFIEFCLSKDIKYQRKHDSLTRYQRKPRKKV